MSLRDITRKIAQTIGIIPPDPPSISDFKSWLVMDLKIKDRKYMQTYFAGVPEDVYWDFVKEVETIAEYLPEWLAIGDANKVQRLAHRYFNNIKIKYNWNISGEAVALVLNTFMELLSDYVEPFEEPLPVDYRYIEHKTMRRIKTGDVMDCLYRGLNGDDIEIRNYIQRLKRITDIADECSEIVSYEGVEEIAWDFVRSIRPDYCDMTLISKVEEDIVSYFSMFTIQRFTPVIDYFN